jgi:hypothetical protein
MLKVKMREPMIGLGGARTHNQRLKRAVIYIYNTLIYSHLRQFCLFVAILLLSPLNEEDWISPQLGLVRPDEG